MVVSKSNPLLHADTPTRRHADPFPWLADTPTRRYVPPVVLVNCRNLILPNDARASFYEWIYWILSSVLLSGFKVF